MKSSIVFTPTVLWLIEQLTLQMMFISIMKGTERPFRISLSWYIKELNTPEVALAVRIQLYSHGLTLTASLWLKLPSDKNVFTAMSVWIRRIRFSVHHNKTSAACRRGQFWSCITQKGCGNNFWSNATVVEHHITLRSAERIPSERYIQFCRPAHHDPFKEHSAAPWQIKKSSCTQRGPDNNYYWKWKPQQGLSLKKMQSTRPQSLLMLIASCIRIEL